MVQRVVLADSDRDASDMYRLGLEDAGYEVSTVPSARALFSFLDGKAEVVVTEYEGLGMPGLEILRRLRERRREQGTRVLVLTNLDGDVEDLAKNAVKGGAKTWLVKAATTPSMLAREVAEALAA